jgi:phenylacetate-coenzyme A ligase PaaK-like adenylate-forming protein
MRILPGSRLGKAAPRPVHEKGTSAVRDDWRQVLSGLHQKLEQVQWQSAQRILAFQHNHLALLVAHAFKTVPWYGRQWSAAGIDADRFDPGHDWRRLPLLRRQDIQKAGSSLQTTALPAEHGAIHEKATGGSTGQPVRVLVTDWTSLWFIALTLRDHLWHGRDFSQTLGVIRYMTHPDWAPPDGAVGRTWGGASAIVGPTGPLVGLSVLADTESQERWLQRRNPGYLLTYPSALHALAERSIQNGARYSNLLEARTFGEVLEPCVRAACHRAWGVGVVDLYSSEEVGYIALQCPTGEHYHVQSESVFVEVIGDDGEPCGPGEVGRVVVTALHNYAMPLIRYDIGDYAEVGQPCRCGRGPLVLNRIMGRQRNMFILPTGRKLWPSFVLAEDEAPLPPLQFQVAQRAIDRIELRLVVDARLTTAQEEQALQRLRRGMGNAFEYTLTYVDHIPRSPRGKYEDFVCEIRD